MALKPKPAESRRNQMDTFVTAFAEAGALLVSFDPDFMSIVGLSLRVSLSAVALACLIGFPLGAIVALTRFPGRGVVVLLLNTFMGLPPVVVARANTKCMHVWSMHGHVHVHARHMNARGGVV